MTSGMSGNFCYGAGEDLSREIVDFCRDKIANLKRPKAVYFISGEEMPRTGIGKIVHRVLQERFGKWSDTV